MRRLLALGVAAACLVGSARAADVLVPDPVSGDVDDLAVAAIFQSFLIQALLDGGVSVDDGDTIRAWAGGAADDCFERPACPANLWERSDARLAVVTSVVRSSEGIDVEARFHGVDDAAPFKVYRERVALGGERALANTLARAARDALRVLPPRAPITPAMTLPDEEILVEGPPAAPPPPVEPVPPAPPPERIPVDRTPSDRLPAVDRAEERMIMGVPARPYARYVESGEARDAWLRRSRVRSGRVFVELAGGWTLGDVDRGYGVRTNHDVEDGQVVTIGTRVWEGEVSGQAAGGTLSVGYAPNWWIDTAVAAGFQLGKKHLDTGWECVAGACDTLRVEELDPPESVSAAQFVLEPRVRFYPVATGIVKPYVLAALTIRINDGFSVPDLGEVEYPDAPGGASWGPTGGLGLAVDAAAPFSIFLEVPVTWLVSPGELESTTGDVTLAPDTLPRAGYALRLTGGIGVRF